MALLPSDKNVFVSYSSKDRERIRPLVAALENEGIEVWWDREIPIGKTFDEVIEEELENSEAVVVVWSNNSIRSNWVLAEAEEAMRRGILVPVMLEETKIPLGFSRIQAANLSDWRPGSVHEDYDRWIDEVCKVLDIPRKSKRGEGETPEPVQISSSKSKAKWLFLIIPLLFVLGILAYSKFTDKAGSTTSPIGGEPIPTSPQPSQPTQSDKVKAGNEFYNLMMWKVSLPGVLLGEWKSKKLILKGKEKKDYAVTLRFAEYGSLSGTTADGKIATSSFKVDKKKEPLELEVDKAEVFHFRFSIVPSINRYKIEMKPKSDNEVDFLFKMNGKVDAIATFKKVVQ